DQDQKVRAAGHGAILLAFLEPLQQVASGHTVRVEADLALEVADRLAAAAADVAVDGPVVEAGRREVGLDELRLLLAQHLLMLRPRGRERAAAADAISEMADGERIGIGVVVALDDAEVLEEQERRPVPSV